MKMRKRLRAGGLLALAFLLVIADFGRVQVTQAAVAIDTDAKCSLTVSVEDSMFLEELNDITIPVSVYKVADVDVSGRFTAVGVFSEMDFGTVSENTTAQEWLAFAQEAEKYRGDEKPAASVEVKKAEGSTENSAASGTITGLDTGLYLVVAEPVFDKDGLVKYVFTSYLTALPGNDYAAGGTENPDASDDWDYHPVIGLKAEAQQQKGRLIITKRLENYNETLGPVSYGFHIVGRDKNGNVIYDNYVKIDMDGAGDKSVTVPDLPAGMTVTVTEEYQGGSYELVSKVPEGDLVIVPDSVVEAGDKEAASVTFTNRYDGGNRGGYGVTNHFVDSDGSGGWIVEKQELQTQE